MADTFDKTKGAAASAYPASQLPKVFVIENVLDMGAAGYVATDIVQVLKILKGSHVLLAGVQIITAEDSTATIDLGDGSDDDGYLAAADAESAAGTFLTSWTIPTISVTNANSCDRTQKGFTIVLQSVAINSVEWQNFEHTVDGDDALNHAGNQLVLSKFGTFGQSYGCHWFDPPV